MPKKTKKEKILAMYHKKLRLLENKQVISSSVEIKTPEIISETPFVKETAVEVKEPPKYFFSDLKKSLLLIILIVGVEVGLYLAGLIK